jgi:hypothetical protein
MLFQASLVLPTEYFFPLVRQVVRLHDPGFLVILFYAQQLSFLKGYTRIVHFQCV